jgi:branched-chain amino acid transport system permease protein
MTGETIASETTAAPTAMWRRAWLRDRDVVAAALLPVLILLLPLVVTSNYGMRVLALIWIMGLAAIGLHIVMGLAGQVSLGHAGFFGIGAYACAVLPKHYDVHPLVAVVAGVAVSAVLAWGVGRPILRLKGHHLAVATLGIALVVGLVLANEVALTGGPDGTAVKRLRIADLSLTKPATWYWIGGALLVVGTAIAVALRASPTGRALRAILDSETAAASLGIDVARRKVQAFVIAAVYASVAGSALALMNGFVTPDVASLMNSIEFVAMVVLGGSSTPIGAIAGAALLTVFPQLFASFHKFQEIAIGLVVMLSMIYLPRGLVPSLWGLCERILGRR